jgi:hypothetical protein
MFELEKVVEEMEKTREGCVVDSASMPKDQSGRRHPAGLTRPQRFKMLWKRDLYIFNNQVINDIILLDEFNTRNKNLS